MAHENNAVKLRQNWERGEFSIDAKKELQRYAAGESVGYLKTASQNECFPSELINNIIAGLDIFNISVR